MENKKFSIVEAFKFGFNTTLEHIIFFLGMFLTWFASFLALITLIGVIAAPYLSNVMRSLERMEGLVPYGKEWASFLFNQPYAMGVVFSGSFFILLLFKLLTVYLLLGFIKVCLEFYDIRTATFKSLFGQTNKLLRGFVATILYSLLILIGLALFFVPGILWAIQFGFVNQCIVDKDMSVMQAFRASSALTKGSRLHLLGLIFVMYVLNLFGSVLFGVGLIITLPVTMLAWTFVYRKLQAMPALAR